MKMLFNPCSPLFLLSPVTKAYCFPFPQHPSLISHDNCLHAHIQFLSAGSLDHSTNGGPTMLQTQSVGEDVGKLEPSSTAGGNEMVQPFWKTA